VAWQHVDNDVPKPSTVVRGTPATLDDLVLRATRRDPGARPTDAGAMLAEVQLVKDDLGAANVETAVLRQVPARPAPHPAAEPTAVFPAAAGDRPAWAKLPEQGGGRRGVSPPIAPDRRTGFVPGGDRRRVPILAAVVLMVLTVAGSAWWVTMGRYTDSPQLVNMTRAQAEQKATQEGFKLFYADGEYSETVKKDVVLDQKPKVDQRIVKGGTITLLLSLGPERYAVPDVTGMELAAAKGELEQVKLKAEEGDGQYSDTVPEGVVISTDPAVNTSLKPGATVTVVVSKGRAPVTVPDLANKNINEARALLQQLGLAAVESYQDDDAAADTVIGQSPKAGTGVEKDAEIKLDVSKGPPLVTVPRVIDQPCPQGQQALQAANLKVRIDFNPNGIVRSQSPPENTPVPPQTEVAIQCF
jgi:serine/threonine-protein kinase